MNADGGSLEIVQYNPVNGFSYGDTTSVSISKDGTKLAAAIQAEDYSAKGIVAVFECNSDGSLALIATQEVGVQPDMVKFVGNDTILTADEGEPRDGENGVDPKGSVSIVKLNGNDTIVNTVYFDKYDAIEFKNYEGVFGIRMPDGIDAVEIGGKTYVLTANEGDSRADWAGYDKEYEIAFCLGAENKKGADQTAATSILDPLMIFGIGPFPRMEMAGAAYATGIGQTVTLIVYLLFVCFRSLPVSIKKEGLSFDKKMLKDLYSVGIPSSLNMMLPSFLLLRSFGDLLRRS